MFTNALKIKMQWARKESDNSAHGMNQRLLIHSWCGEFENDNFIFSLNKDKLVTLKLVTSKLRGQ